GAVVRASRGRLSAADPTVTVGSAQNAQPVASTFLGFSFEYWALPDYAGTNSGAIDPVFERLLGNLTDGRPTVIRIGGIATDHTWWPVQGLRPSPAVYYTVTRRRLEVVAALARAANAHLIMGVNFEADSSVEAAAESRATMTVIGRRLVEGIELGNEPEDYNNPFFPFYKLDGNEVLGRPASWDFQLYLSDYQHIAAGLGNVPLAGPAIGAYSWLAYLGQYLNAEHVSVVTLHTYPLQACGFRPGEPGYPSIPHLLSSASSIGLADALQPYVALAHAHGELVRSAEMNSVSCGRVPRTANTFASALWVLDAWFAMASVGLDGVNIHIYPGVADQLFSINHAHGRWTADVAPEYYGVLMFSQAAPPGSHLLQVSGISGRGTLRAWATRTPSGGTRVVLINDAVDHPQYVTLRLPQSMGALTVERLEAPSVTSTSGVTIGGQTFGSQTTTGRLSQRFVAGTSPGDKLSAAARTYRIRLPAASAAMLTFS
ncbi:MAG TPA: glycosyl hydrolase family 79 C-terminal domain-containing protein, partial [Galbitalea sp.]